MSEAFDFRSQKPAKPAPTPVAPAVTPTWYKGDPSVFEVLSSSRGSAFGTLPIQAGGRLPLTPEQDAKLDQAGVPKYQPDEVPIYGEPTLPVAPDHPPLEVKLRDISELSATEQAAAMKAIREVQSVNQPRRVAPAIAAELPPIGQVIEVPDDPKPAPNQLDKVALSPSGAAGLAVCPNCKHELSTKPDPEPDAADRRAFLSSLAGGRFTKEHSFYGGALRVKFRTLTAVEIATINQQMRHEYDPKLSLMEHMRRVNLYWRAAAVAEVHVHGMPSVIIPPLSELPWDGPSAAQDAPTVLPLLLERLDKTAWAAQSTYQVIEQAYMKFTALVSRLEDLRFDPDFTAGIV